MSAAEVPISLATDVAASETLFPLPLTSFERLMLLDDRSAYPMTYHVELGFLGSLEREAIEGAFEYAARRHPLLISRIEKRRGSWHWSGPVFESSAFQWREGDAAFDQADAPVPIDLTRENGLRLIASRGAERSSVALHMHHSCSDGQGARKFIYDLLSAYERFSRGEESRRAASKFDEIERALLAKRERTETGVKKTEDLEPPRPLWEQLRNAVAYVTCFPARLAAGAKKTTSTLGGEIRRHLFSIEESDALRRTAQADGATLNDLAMTVLFQTIAAWNREFGSARDRHALRILMPTDLRERDDDFIPAVNRVGYGFLTRTIAQTRDYRSLLETVRAETAYIKDNRVGLDFVRNTALAQKIPGLVPAYLRFTHCMATAVLTNLGDPTRRLRRRFASEGTRPVVGNLLLDHIHGTPPIRPGTRAGFGLCVCSGRLSVSMLADSSVYSSDERREILSRYVKALLERSEATRKECGSHTQ